MDVYNLSYLPSLPMLINIIARRKEVYWSMQTQAASAIHVFHFIPCSRSDLLNLLASTYTY
jgi:hypothetical protein